MSKGLLLHVGCGGSPIPDWLSNYKEVRLDIDASHSPDIVADMCDLGDIGTYDLVFSQHSLEHLYPHDCKKALSEFYRVLNPNGVLIVFVPNLEGVSATEEVLFTAPVGDITGLDLIYGYRCMLAEKPYMAHRNGFVPSTLESVLTEAGFKDVTVKTLPHNDMMGACRK